MLARTGKTTRGKLTTTDIEKPVRLELTMMFTSERETHQIGTSARYRRGENS